MECAKQIVFYFSFAVVHKMNMAYKGALLYHDQSIHETDSWVAKKISLLQRIISVLACIGHVCRVIYPCPELSLSLSLPYLYPSSSSSSTKSSPMTPSWRPSLPSPSTSPFLHDPSPIHIHVGLVSDMLTAGGCCSFGRFSDFPPAEIPKMVLYPCCLTINSAEFNRCGFNIAWKSKLMYGKFMYINIDLKIDTAGNESNGPMFRCNTHTYISWTTSAMQIYIIHVCVKHFQ